MNGGVRKGRNRHLSLDSSFEGLGDGDYGSPRSIGTKSVGTRRKSTGHVNVATRARVEGLACKLDAIDERLEHLAIQLQEEVDVQNLERKMKILAVLRKIDEIEIRQSEFEQRLSTDFSKRVELFDNQVIVLKNDIKVSLERFREAMNAALEKMNDEVKNKFDTLTESILNAHSRILVLEEEASRFSSVHQAIDQVHQKNCLLENQIEQIKAQMEEVQSENRKLAHSSQSVLAIVQRAFASR